MPSRHGHLAARLRRSVARWTQPATRLYRYPDEETYRRIQQRGNEQKLTKIWAIERNIAHIARYAERRIGPVASVLCHGSRNGAELRWFEAALGSRATVLGTDISSSAPSFEGTIQWDFHELDPRWEAAWDLVYSNSWDHARDPARAFGSWLRSLNDRGLLILEHSERHEPRRVSALDPFGATIKGLTAMLDAIDPARFRVVAVEPLPDADRRMIVAGRVNR